MNFFKYVLLLAAWSPLIGTASTAIVAAAQVELDPASQTDAEKVELKGFRGEAVTWPPQQQRPTVVAFLGTGCPLAKLYAGRLQELSVQYQGKIDFIAVAPHPQDSLEELAAFAREHRLDFEFARDLGQRLSRQLGITRTPEVVLLDPGLRVCYQGRVDDQYGVGYQKKTASREDLKLAIESLLTGQPIATAKTEAPGCLITYGREPQGEATITFASHVAPILNEHCVRCHRDGQIGPFAMTDYEEVAGWAEMIAEVVKENRMPPWHADPQFGKWANDCSLASDERQTLLDWVAAGAPPGDLAKLPPSPEFVEGWQLSKTPDLILKITDQPNRIRAKGDIKYQYFVVDPKFNEDKWVQAAEIRPGNLRVLHHVLCFIRPRGAEGLGGSNEGVDGFLCGYVPGMLPQTLPAGMAKRIPKDSELVFQVHYTPIGSPQEDLSQIGLVFVDSQKITHEVVTTSAVNPRISIPAGKKHHAETAWNRRPLSGEWPIISLMPHLHLRGEAFKYEAVLPDGKRLTLLDVPKYDFNWQTSYLAAEPLRLPAGTKIFCTARYDNSSGNLSNPDPASEVRWGDQTWEEMMIGYFDVAIPLDEVAARREFGPAASADEALREQAQRLLQRWDKNENAKVELEEIPQRWRAMVQAVSPGKEISLSYEELVELLKQLKR